MRYFESFIAKRFYLVFGLAALLMSDLVVAAEYPYLYRSPAYLGRGDTGISDANDENALLYNPAGIVMGPGVHRRTGVSLGLQTTDDIAVEAYNTVMGDEPSETTELLTDRLGKPINIGANAFVGTVYSRYGIGAYLNSTSTVMLAKDPDFGAFETATINSVTQGGFVSTTAIRLAPKQSLGISTRYVYKVIGISSFYGTDTENVSESNTNYVATGFGYDLGYRYYARSRDSFSFGATLENIGNTSYDQVDNDDGLELDIADDPMTLNLGLSYEKTLQVTRFKVLVDYRDVLGSIESSIFKRLHIGSELNLSNIVGIMAGFNQGYPTIGAYIDVKVLRFDIGMYTEEIGSVIGERPSKRVYARAFIGF